MWDRQTPDAAEPAALQEHGQMGQMERGGLLCSELRSTAWAPAASGWTKSHSGVGGILPGPRSASFGIWIFGEALGDRIGRRSR